MIYKRKTEKKPTNSRCRK